MENTQTSRRGIIIGILATIIPMLCGCGSDIGWRARFDAELPALGHRNWIAVTDSAYPKQSAEGIETIATGESLLDVLEYVVNEVEKAPHVQGVYMRDAELESLLDRDIPGVEDYRDRLKALLSGKRFIAMPHEEIIAKLDQSSKMFDVLVLKTKMVIPYSSIFIELDCGYWNSEKERRRLERLEEQ